MAQQTAIDWLIEQYVKDGLFKQGVYEQSKAMEKEQIINAIMYALDEDGHTGDWKIKFANDYYESINK